MGNIRWLVVLFVISVVFISGCSSGSGGGVICKNVVKEFKGCDSVQGCRCLHESWGGLGACDTCECQECLVH